MEAPPRIIFVHTSDTSIVTALWLILGGWGFGGLGEGGVHGSVFGSSSGTLVRIICTCVYGELRRCVHQSVHVYACLRGPGSFRGTNYLQ